MGARARARVSACVRASVRAWLRCMGCANVLPLLAPQVYGTFLEVAASELHRAVRHRERAGHASRRTHQPLAAESPRAPPGRLRESDARWGDRRSQPLALHKAELNGDCGAGSAHENCRLRPRLEHEFPRVGVRVEDDRAEAAESEQPVGCPVYADAAHVHRDVRGIRQRHEVRGPTAFGPAIARDWLRARRGHGKVL
jgi:hypothetical protein